MECEFCKKILNNKSALNVHQKNTKYCLKMQGNSQQGKFVCECGKDFHNKHHLISHQDICRIVNTVYVQELRNRVNTAEQENIILSSKLSDALITIKDLQDRLENITLQAINRPWETIVEIEKETEIPEESSDEPYELVPLELNNGYIIESREDGYINIKNLCKAGGKEFKDWNSLGKTKEFLKALSIAVGIPISLLIHLATDIWVHPQVAINIAQWISPQFDIKVSAWVLEVMMTGKVDITNTKSYRELKQDNKNKQLKIQLMTKKYVKKQPRTQYEEENVIYILTTANMKKERRYILGKATNLTSRLSVYNKSDEHEVVYYQECPDEQRMSIVESLVFCKLNQYREQANRERFLLPEDAQVNLFSDTIKNCIEFVKCY